MLRNLLHLWQRCLELFDGFADFVYIFLRRFNIMPADLKLLEYLLVLSDCRQIDHSKLLSHGVKCFLRLINLGLKLFLLLFRLLGILLCLRLLCVCAFFEFILVRGQTLPLFHQLLDIAADSLLHLICVGVCLFFIKHVFATDRRL